MKINVTMSTALVATTALAGPVIEQETIECTQSPHVVKISYVLANAPAVVTMEVWTNTLPQGAGEWLKVDGRNVQSLSGDVCKLIQPSETPKEIVWRVHRDLPPFTYSDGRVKFKLTAWRTYDLPDWMVVGLETANDVRYYATTNDIPYGFGSDVYKTSQLLMRRMHCRGVTWKSGDYATWAPTAASNADNANLPHPVVLTEDYYIGVYEFTVGQLWKVTGEIPWSKWNSYDDFALRPVVSVGMSALRGQNASSFEGDGYWWPKTGHQVSESSYIGQIRERTGLRGLDLPTQAQWEFACRAGNYDSWFGRGISGGAFRTYAWYSGNSTEQTTDGVAQVHAVGMLEPNDYLLYDMHGNVREICLDRATRGDDFIATLAMGYSKGGVTVDPDGGMVGSQGLATSVLKLGGSYLEDDFPARAGARSSGGYSYTDAAIGFRVVTPAYIGTIE